MTKAEAKQLAQSARHHGYYRDGATLSLSCPRKCGERISTERLSGLKPAGKGKPYSQMVDGKPHIWRQESVAEALDRAVIDHLDWCGIDQAV